MIILAGSALALWPGILEPRLLVAPLLFASCFVLGNLVAGPLIGRLVEGFKPKWAYLIVLFNQLLLLGAFLVFRLSGRITFLDSIALWTVLAYTAWMLTLTGLGALRIGSKSVALSMLQPALMWLLLAGSVELHMEALPILIMAAGMTVSTLIVLFNEHLFSLVFAGISGMAELSKFFKGLRGEQVELDLGHHIDAPLQYVKFKLRGGRESVIVAPWLHSGPIRSVGGGNLSTQCIEELNRDYGNSYFLHVPSSHEYNPSAKVAERVVDAIKPLGYEPLRVSKAVKAEGEGIIVRGQRFNDVFLVSLASELIDDYDITIFASLREKHKDKKVVFIDSHPNYPMKRCINVEAFSREARIIEGLIAEVLKKLSKEPLRKADVGTALQAHGQYSVFALAIETGGETILYFVADTNGFSENETRAIRETAKDLGIDHTLFFTTDTHAFSVKALIERPDIPKGVMESVVRRAVADIGPAEFAYGEDVLKGVRILGETYYELATLVNIMARVTPVLFLLFFLFLTVALWIF